MATMFTNANKLSLKILYDKNSKKVLIAEADKEAVDFLFYMLSLPLATVTTLLSKSKMGMVGCLNNLNESVSNMDRVYFLEGEKKDMLLNPLHSFSVQAPFLLPDTTKHTNYKIYKCLVHNVYYYSISKMTSCRQCPDHKMGTLQGGEIVAPDSIGSGFVKGFVKYIVMDNLVVKPVSSICMLKDLNVKDLGNVQEVVVDMGLEEGLKILKASMEGGSVITSVYFDKLV